MSVDVNDRFPLAQGATFSKNITGYYSDLRLVCTAAPCNVAELKIEGAFGTASSYDMTRAKTVVNSGFTCAASLG